MVKPDLIIKSYRRSLSLTISKTGELIVRAPKRLSADEIMKYIAEKEKWILSKQQEIQSRLSINKDIINYNQIQFLGKKYSIEKINGIKKIELSDKSLILPAGIDNQVSRIKSWFIKIAKKILVERLEYFADLMQVDYSSVTINNSKSRWGSCDSNRNIKLNFRLVMLPHKALDFVLIHELAHIVEFNHSKEFYKVVASIMPSYKLQQKILKEHDYLLNVYR